MGTYILTGNPGANMGMDTTEYRENLHRSPTNGAFEGNMDCRLHQVR